MKTEYLITYRNLIAKNGHNDLMDYFEECANSGNTASQKYLLSTINNYRVDPMIICNIIKNHINIQKESTNKEKVKSFLKENSVPLLPFRTSFIIVYKAPDSILTKDCAFVKKIECKQIKSSQYLDWRLSLRVN